METYNAAADLIERNLPHFADKVAIIDDNGAYTYAELAERVRRFAGYLRAADLPTESRVLICLEDSASFPVACLGAIVAGLVPVLVNPLLTSADLDYMLEDSRARLLVASASAWPAFVPIVEGKPELGQVLVADGESPDGAANFDEVVAAAEPLVEPVRTRADEPCLWQYSSGTTGRAKGTIHTHHNVRELMGLYPREILEISANDITFSAAKLFFDTRSCAELPNSQDRVRAGP